MRLLCAISILASAVFSYLLYEQYFKWRGLFNEEGRYFDAETGVVYSEQSGMVWITLLACSLFCTAMSGIVLLKK